MAIEEMERPAARERMSAGGRVGAALTNGVSSQELTPFLGGHQTRDIAAEAVGMSGATFTRMKTIVTVAGNEGRADYMRTRSLRL